MNRRTLVTGLACGIGGGALGFFANEIKPRETCNLKGTALDDLHIQVCAFHVAKDNPNLQVEAHHYCMPLSEGVFQCVVMEPSQSNAKSKILGVEYIIVDDIYKKLTEDEKKYWHPHDYEVTSGLLVAPGISVEEENKLMGTIIKSWGKTIHTWSNPKESLPLGPPTLMWSFTKDGEIDQNLLKARDKRLGINTEEIKKRRVNIGN